MQRDFKGIWIPKKIWLLTGLKPTYRIFLAEIDSLDNGEGCFAKNAHFAKLFGLSVNRCSEIITMLHNEHYIEIYRKDIDGEERRIINVSDPFGKSTTPSTFRQTPSRNRQTPSENRQRIYKELEIQLETIERVPRALDYIFLHHEELFTTQFLMKYVSQIKDFKKFWFDFNDTADIEQLDYDYKVIFPRLEKYARNWIQNQEKYQPREVAKSDPYKSMR